MSRQAFGSDAQRGSDQHTLLGLETGLILHLGPAQYLHANLLQTAIWSQSGHVKQSRSRSRDSGDLLLRAVPVILTFADAGRTPRDKSPPHFSNPCGSALYIRWVKH